MLHIVLVLFFGLKSLNCNSLFTECNDSITASYEKLGSNGLPANVGSSNERICYYLDYSGSLNMTVNKVIYVDPYIYCPSSDSKITFTPSGTEIYYTEAFVFNESYAKYGYVYIATSDLSLNFPLDDESLGYKQNSTLRALGQLILLAHTSADYAVKCSEPKCEGIFVDYEDESRKETAAGFFLAYGSHTTRSNTPSSSLNISDTDGRLLRRVDGFVQGTFYVIQKSFNGTLDSLVACNSKVDEVNDKTGIPKWALWIIGIVVLIIVAAVALWMVCRLQGGVSACCAKLV